jgi:hypothetical protein
VNTIEGWGTPTKNLKGDLNLISMPNLLEGAWGLEGWGTIVAIRRANLKNPTLPLMVHQADMHK